MDREKKYVTIVDRNYPPSKGINGESACDLAQYLLGEFNIQPIIVHVDIKYEGGGQSRNPVGEIHTVPTVYNGKNKILRLIGSLYEGFLLSLKVKKVGKGLIICMTNPPLLQYWIAGNSNKPYGLWSMDLYPEAFVAAGLIRKSNILVSWLEKKIKRHPPKFLIALGLNQGRFITSKLKMEIPTFYLPCGVFLNNMTKVKPLWYDDEKINIGYIGNIGEAHSAEFVMEMIKQIESHKHNFILVAYGSKSMSVLEFARKSKKSIKILDSIDRAQLEYIDVNLVSLLSQWTHVCVPSKAVSAICSNSPVLFYGSKDSDNWDLLKEASWHIDAKSDLDQQIQYFLEDLSKSSIEIKKENAKKISDGLSRDIQATYKEIGHFLNSY